MKLLTREEEEAHYRETLKGGIGGGLAGLAVGFVGVYAAAARYPAFRHMTLPLKAFLITSSGTFTAIISADKYSRAFEAARHTDEGYKDTAARDRASLDSQKSPYQKFMHWGKENRYPIVGASWVASMAISLGLVGRSPYLSTQQKIVQARVYAQGLTLAVLLATAVFEIGDRSEDKGRWETVKIVDPNDPEHKHLIDKRVHHESYAGEDTWRDMVETEERKMKERQAAAREQEERDIKAGKVKPKKHESHAHHKEGKKPENKGEEHDNSKEAKK